MKWSQGVLAGALVILVVACGASTPQSTTPPPAHASASATTPAPNLNAELLAIGDLPAGWSVQPSTDSTSATPKCLQNIKTSLKTTSKAEVTFEGASSGLPELDESLGYLPGQGPNAIKLVRQILAGCGQISVTSDGDTLTGTVGAMSFPAVADQSAAYQINLTGSVSGLSVTVGIDLVVFRKADTVAVIVYGDLGTPDILALQTIVQDAAAKLS